MITTVFLLILSGLLAAVTQLLSVIAIAIPINISDSFNLLFSKVRLWDGVFPASTLLQALTFLALVYIFVYTVKIILWAYSLLPFVGHKVDTPKLAHKRR